MSFERSEKAVAGAFGEKSQGHVYFIHSRVHFCIAQAPSHPSGHGNSPSPSIQGYRAGIWGGYCEVRHLRPPFRCYAEADDDDADEFSGSFLVAWCHSHSLRPCSLVSPWQAPAAWSQESCLPPDSCLRPQTPGYGA